MAEKTETVSLFHRLDIWQGSTATLAGALLSLFATQSVMQERMQTDRAAMTELRAQVSALANEIKTLNGEIIRQSEQLKMLQTLPAGGGLRPPRT